MTILGIDWGEKHIGLALGESETKIASPFKAVSTIKELLVVIKEEGIEVLVLGEPKKMQEHNRVDARFTDFLNKLKIETNLPIHLVDERLSSHEANKLIRGEKDHSVAAMIILQRYLDRE
ncbi:MAG: Holliday junction resolvase RuvX [Planctomycetes bacterium]|jgi:putative Holliday junction resolvase|nr:Holliday junction resolvase RuvX [Planctomycetota bacterium]